MPTNTSTRSTRPKPFFYWALWAGFLIFSLSGWVRMADVIYNWYWYTRFGVDPSPLYLAVSGGVWGVIGVFPLIWMALRRPWYRLVSLISALLYAILFWLDRLLIVPVRGAPDNDLFALPVTILLLIFVFIVIRPASEFQLLFTRLRGEKS